MQGRGGEMMEPEGTGDLAAASDMVVPGCAEGFGMPSAGYPRSERSPSGLEGPCPA